MKFEFEKLDIPYLRRRAIEEENRTGKRVTRITLTRSEWAEFMVEFNGSRRCYGDDFLEPPIRHVRFHINRMRVEDFNPANRWPCQPELRVNDIEVVCE